MRKVKVAPSCCSLAIGTVSRVFMGARLGPSLSQLFMGAVSLCFFSFLFAEFPVFLDHCIPPCRSYQNFMGASAAMDRKSYIPLVHRFDSAIIPNLPSRSAVGPHG